MRRIRQAEGLTQEAASERGGLDLRHWQKLEAAESNATLGTLVKVAGALGVFPGELLVPIRRRG